MTEQEQRYHPAIVCVLLSMFGGGFGFVASIVFGLVGESPTAGTPTLSYGQQFGLIIVPLCTLVGAGIGFAAGIAYARCFRTAVFLLLAISLSGWAATSAMWNSQIANYGRDPSEVVLYYPPSGMCVLALCTAVAICLHSIRTPRDQKELPER